MEKWTDEEITEFIDDVASSFIAVNETVEMVLQTLKLLQKRIDKLDERVKELEKNG